MLYSRSLLLLTYFIHSRVYVLIPNSYIKPVLGLYCCIRDYIKLTKLETVHVYDLIVSLWTRSLDTTHWGLLIRTPQGCIRISASPHSFCVQGPSRRSWQNFCPCGCQTKVPPPAWLSLRDHSALRGRSQLLVFPGFLTW